MSRAAPPPEVSQPSIESEFKTTPEGYVPYLPPPPPANSVFSLQLATLPTSAPFTWLAKGWQDYKRCPKIGLFYGLCFFIMGHALWFVFHAAPAYVLALSAGFLLVGPFLCLGIYDASRASESGVRRPSLKASWVAWAPAKGAMAIFAVLLLILEMLWGRASLVVFAVTFNSLPTTENLLAEIVRVENLEFLITYTLVGAAFAGLIFITSVISIPMILDRQTDAISASLTSIRACLENPGVMLMWGALITVIVVVAMLPYFLGLLVAGPWLGHATWHAYRAAVPAENRAVR